MRAGLWLDALCVGLLAFLVRLLPWSAVIGGASLVFPNPDAYYHMRRILYSVAHFPAVLDFDPYIHYPEGGRVIWGPGFDLFVAFWARLLVGSSDVHGVELVASFVPPLLGVATVVATWAVALRHLGRAPALVAGFLLGVLPPAIVQAQLGSVDHHVAVSLLSVLLLAWALAQLPAPVRSAGPALTLGVLLAAGLLVWPGFLLHAALLLAYVGLRVVLLRDAATALRLSRCVAGATALCAGLVLPFAWGNEWPRWGSFSPSVLSHFQPWLFATLALAFASVSLLRNHAAGRGVRALVLAGIAAGSLVLAARTEPDFDAGVADALAWLTRREAFQATVVESLPLFAPGGRFTTALAIRRLSWLFLLFPLMLAALARSPGAFRSADGRAFFAYWALVWLVLAALQQRFLDTFMVPYVLACGLGLVAAWRLARSRLSGAAATAALALATALALAPLRHDLRPWLSLGWDGLRGVEPRLPPTFALLTTFHEVAVWIREHTPETRGFLDPAQRPEYAVLANLNLGHVVTYAARRPTLVDNFGDDLGEDHYARMMDGTFWEEEAALALRDGLGVRYVVTGGGLWDPAAVTHHRLVHESRSLNGRSPLLRVFERVPGARLSGRAAPGSEVEATLAIATAHGTSTLWRARAVAEDGSYELRLPYATGALAGDVRTARQATLACAGRRVALTVPEAAVREGLVLEGPDCR